jgi:hypothetical protein
MTDDPEYEGIVREILKRRMERLLLAVKLGETARLRLRAECLLERDGEIPLDDFERAELDRIAVAPTKDDRIFLDGFDLNRFLED